MYCTCDLGTEDDPYGEIPIEDTMRAVSASWLWQMKDIYHLISKLIHNVYFIWIQQTSVV